MNRLNATCEFIGAGLAWVSVFELWHAHAAQGVFWWQFAFSAFWSLECVFYYHRHADRASAAGAVLRCLGLAAWCALAVRL